MYFQSIEIKNYGSISNFHYQFRFDELGRPIPLVLIGENGSGKTLAITNMVDALVEIKRKVYDNMLREVNEYHFYKIGSTDYIKKGESTSQVVVILKHAEKALSYIDIMSRDPEKALSKLFPLSNDLFPLSKEFFPLPKELSSSEDFKQDGYFRKSTGKIERKNFSDFILLYFPVDRFYLPMWYNSENYNRIDYSRGTHTLQPNSNMIKTDVLSNIKDWLASVYLYTEAQPCFLGDHPEIPPELRNSEVQIQTETCIQKRVRELINHVLGTTDYKCKGISRKENSVSFSAGKIDCVDISQLSEGQMSLIAIAVSILKEWDIEHDDFQFDDISGCVIIDEADLGLHITYAHDAFPRIMQLFPNVQFIITTHSPFMVAGLFDTLGEKIDIVTMPEGITITSIDAFSEAQRAEELISSEIAELREIDKALKNEISQLQKVQNKVILFTEGITDCILLNKAMEKLNITDLPIKFLPASQNNGEHSDAALKQLMKTLKENPCTGNLIIGLFDRDAEPSIKMKDINEKEVELIGQKYVELSDHLFAFALPVPHGRQEVNQISIEHYFTDDEIKTQNEDNQRLFLANEFLPTGNHIDGTQNYNYNSKNIRKICKTIKIIEHEQNYFVTDREGNGNYSISKKRFAEAIRDDRPGFENFDFSEFKKVFEVILEIIETDKKTQQAK